MVRETIASPDLATTQPPPPPKSRRRRAWRRVVLVLALGICAGLMHRPMLRGLGRVLVVDEGTAGADYFCLLCGIEGVGDDGQPFALAASFYHENPQRRVLIVEPRLERLERIGVLPTFESIVREELEVRGVPRRAIWLIPGAARTRWEQTRALQGWLKEHPAVRVVVVSGCFQSRHARKVLDNVLGADEAERVQVLAVRESGGDATDWWRNRRGVRQVFGGYVSLAYLVCQGEPPPRDPEWNPDDYEKWLSERSAGTP